MYVEPSNRVRSCTISYSLHVCVCVCGCMSVRWRFTRIPPIPCRIQTDSHARSRTLATALSSTRSTTPRCVRVGYTAVYVNPVFLAYVQRHSRVPDAHSLAAKSHLTIDALLPSCTRLHVYACLRVQASFCRHTETKKLTTTSELRVCARSRSR